MVGWILLAEQPDLSTTTLKALLFFTPHVTHHGVLKFLKFDSAISPIHLSTYNNEILLHSTEYIWLLLNFLELASPELEFTYSTLRRDACNDTMCVALYAAA